MHATSFWALLIIGLFNFDPVSTPARYIVTMLPLSIPIVSCTVGIIRGIVFFKREKYAKTCLLLSILGLIIYSAVIYLCGLLGSVL